MAENVAETWEELDDSVSVVCLVSATRTLWIFNIAAVLQWGCSGSVRVSVSVRVMVTVRIYHLC